MLKVLIVEDDVNVSRLHVKFTEKMDGFEVIGIANDLDDAFDMVELFKPDLILLDIFFPFGSGLDFLRDIRGKGSQADVILITAAREAQSIQEAMHGGAFDYIVKPVIFERFKKSLQRFSDYRRELGQDTAFDQGCIDHLLDRGIETGKFKSELPKGIDSLTLEKVVNVLDNSSDSLTAEEVAHRIGASRNTGRRYLEYLVSIGSLKVDIDYGTIGRPEKKFSQLS
jgi:response regulator of citrate/malate metabolism